MEIKLRKISPLMALVIISVVFSGAMAAWYWFSSPLEYSITVEGNIVATTNYDGDVLGSTPLPTYAEVVAACENVLYPTAEPNQFIIRVVSNGGNPTVVYTKLEMTLPGSTTATAEVWVSSILGGVSDSGGSVNLGSIAVDGSESVQVLHDTAPRWFLLSDFEGGDVRQLVFLIDVNWAQNLPIGSHTISAVVHLGDSP